MERLSSLSAGSSSINVQTLLLQAYRSINEVDGIYGFGAGLFSDTNSRLHTYQHEHKWDQALATYDIQCRQGHPRQEASYQLGLYQALANCGLEHVLHTCLQGLAATHPDRHQALAEFQFETAWRNSNWDLDTFQESVPSPDIVRTIGCQAVSASLSSLFSTLPSFRMLKYFFFPLYCCKQQQQSLGQHR